jgi:hypothetical protein
MVHVDEASNLVDNFEEEFEMEEDSETEPVLLGFCDRTERIIICELFNKL